MAPLRPLTDKLTEWMRPPTGKVPLYWRFRSGMLYGKEGELYVRRGHTRFSNGELHDTLIVARLEILPTKRGRGYFTNMLFPALIEEARTAKRALVMECVLNERLLAFLLRNGFTPQSAEGTENTLWRILDPVSCIVRAPVEV